MSAKKPILNNVVGFDSAPGTFDLSDYGDKTVYSQHQSTKNAWKKLLMDVTDGVEILEAISNDINRCELLEATANMALIWNPLRLMILRITQIVTLAESFIEFEETEDELGNFE